MNHTTVTQKKGPCPYWMAGMLDNPLRRLMHDPRKIFAGLVEEGQTVVDLGCGPGYFTLGMARLVGDTGRVIAVDLQPEMLAMVRKKAARQSLLSRLTLHPCAPNRIGLEGPVDFALAFWMVHEVPDPEAFLGEVFAMLKPGGRFLMVEPKMHVVDAGFEKTVERAKAAGLVPLEERQVRMSRALLFEKPAAR